MVELVGVGSVIDGASPSSLNINKYFFFMFFLLLFSSEYTFNGLFRQKFLSPFVLLVRKLSFTWKLVIEKCVIKIPHTGDKASLDRCG